MKKERSIFRKKIKEGMDPKIVIKEFYEKMNLSYDEQDYIIPSAEGGRTKLNNWHIYPTEKIFPLKKIKFNNKTYSCPNDVNYCLIKAYGDYRSIPKIVFPHKRINWLKTIPNIEKNFDTFIKKLRKINEEFNLEKNYCPFCGKHYVFQPFGIHPRERARCPECGSLERHRFVYMILEQRVKHLLNNNSKVLHFAPERIFYNYFKGKDIDYYPVDFNPDLFKSRNMEIREKINMENITYPDNSFDVVYNSHVLEHVTDDIKAMSELYRVLKPNGICITLVPLSNRAETLENDEYNTPELRLKYYGQQDHMRKYGQDFKSRLESVGFNVEKIRPENVFSYEEKKQYNLGGTIFLCTK